MRVLWQVKLDFEHEVVDKIFLRTRKGDIIRCALRMHLYWCERPAKKEKKGGQFKPSPDVNKPPYNVDKPPRIGQQSWQKLEKGQFA